MAEVQSSVDPFSLTSRIERSEQRVARQREIVEALVKYNVAGPAQRLLALMEEALAELREQAGEPRTGEVPAGETQAAMPDPAPAPEPAREEAAQKLDTVAAD